MVQKFLQLAGSDSYKPVCSPIIYVQDTIYNYISAREDASAVESVRFIMMFRRQYRLLGPGDDLQRIVLVQQQGSYIVLSLSGVSHSVVQHQPSVIGKDRRRTASYLFLPGAGPSSNETMALLVFPTEQVIRELYPYRREHHSILLAYILFRAVEKRIFSTYLLREKYDIPVIQDRRSDPAQTSECLEIPGHRQTGIADILLQGCRSIAAALREKDDIVREGPVLSRRMDAIGVCDVELVTELHDARILHTAAVRSVKAGTEHRTVSHTGEIEAILTYCETKADNMFRLVTGRSVEHIEGAVVIYHTRITGHEVFPLIIGIRGDDGIVRKFLKSHKSTED